MALHTKFRATNSFFFVIVLFAALMVACSAGPVWADEITDTEIGSGVLGSMGSMVGDLRGTLRTDAFRIRPRYRQEIDLDDNILREDEDDKFDVIFREIPGAEISIPMGEHYIKADYEAVFEQFAKAEEQNDINQYLRTKSKFNFTDFYVKIIEDVVQTSSRAGTTFTERIPRFENTLEGTVGYRMNDILLESGYHDFYRSFDSTPSKTLNYHAWGFHNRAFMEITPKTKGFVEYDFTRYNYEKDEARDQTGHEIFAGVTGHLLPKTTVYAKFGYERVTADLSSRADGDAFVMDFGAFYTPTEKTEIDASWVRSQEQATFSDVNFFTEDRIKLNINHRISDKISGNASVQYVNQDYEDLTTPGDAGAFIGDRDDDLFAAVVGVVYDFTDWLRADLQYQYARRDSNAGAFDYTQNLFSMGVSLEV